MLAFGGCETSYQAKQVKPSGFLDYSLLRKGGEGEALYVYRNPKADFSTYDKVLFDKVMVWRGKGSTLNDFSQEDLQCLGSLLRNKVLAALSSDYEIVYESGPGVMRIQVALTELEKSSTVMDTISTVLPAALALSEVKRVTTGTHAFVGKASIEGKITDGQTGELLLAAVDRRTGGKRLEGKTSSLHQVEEIYQFWADRLSQRLREWRIHK
ncbi:MAG: DUF3313 family protein [Nitrospirales bacterium]|nr:DUF3313 family protein [Nitrospirales bacterium]